MSVKKIKILIDLDKTIWDTYDKYGNSIWAKQLVAPIKKKNSNVLIDDVFSTCTLRKGVRKFLNYVYDHSSFSVSFITNGMYFNLPKKYQPSLISLKLFGIGHFFNSKNFLLYKTASKAKILSEMHGLKVLFDDNEKIINECSSIKNTIVVDSNDIDWVNQIKNINDLKAKWGAE